MFGQRSTNRRLFNENVKTAALSIRSAIFNHAWNGEKSVWHFWTQTPTRRKPKVETVIFHLQKVNFHWRTIGGSIWTNSATKLKYNSAYVEHRNNRRADQVVMDSHPCELGGAITAVVRVEYVRRYLFASCRGWCRKTFKMAFVRRTVDWNRETRRWACWEIYRKIRTALVACPMDKMVIFSTKLGSAYL